MDKDDKYDPAEKFGNMAGPDLIKKIQRALKKGELKRDVECNPEDDNEGE